MQRARLAALDAEHRAWELLESYAGFKDPEVEGHLVAAAKGWHQFKELAAELAGAFGRFEPETRSPGFTRPAYVNAWPDGYYKSLQDADERMKASQKAAER